MEQAFSPANITDASSPGYPDSLSPPPVSRMASTSPAVSFEKRLDEVKTPKADAHAMILNYLVLNGYGRTARTFMRETGFRLETNDYDMQARVMIKRDILNGNIDDAVEKINDLNPEILDKDPKLHFSLLRLQLIEIIRRGNPDKKDDLMTAINFANRNLAPRTKLNPQFIEDLELAMALVIFPRDNLPNELNALLDPDLRQRTADAVNQAILKSQNAGQPSKIGELLKARQWSEQKCRETKKPIPSRISLGIEKEKDDDSADGDVQMKNGNDGNTGSADRTGANETA